MNNNNIVISTEGMCAGYNNAVSRMIDLLTTLINRPMKTHWGGVEHYMPEE